MTILERVQDIEGLAEASERAKAALSAAQGTGAEEGAWLDAELADAAFLAARDEDPQAADLMDEFAVRSN